MRQLVALVVLVSLSGCSFFAYGPPRMEQGEVRCQDDSRYAIEDGVVGALALVTGASFMVSGLGTTDFGETYNDVGLGAAGFLLLLASLPVLFSAAYGASRSHLCRDSKAKAKLNTF
jgi:hypothetical protein